MVNRRDPKEYKDGLESQPDVVISEWMSEVQRFIDSPKVNAKVKEHLQNFYNFLGSSLTNAVAGEADVFIEDQKRKCQKAIDEAPQ